jgi:hypothetical protein
VLVLAKSQIRRIANILDNLGQVIMASVFFQNLKDNKIFAVIGLATAFILWSFSISFERKTL